MKSHLDETDIYIEWEDKKAKARDRKKRKRMKVTGKGVFQILNIKRRR